MSTTGHAQDEGGGTVGAGEDEGGGTVGAGEDGGGGTVGAGEDGGMNADAMEAFGDAFGGPGPEAWANGTAALISALAREAQVLAGAAASLRAVCAPQIGDHAGGPLSDIRRQRLALGAAGEAALRAALALEAADALAAATDPEAQAARVAAAAKRAGLLPAIAAPLLRAAALDFRTDDAAARIAATTIAGEIAARLERG